MCSRSWRPGVRLLQAGDTNKNDPNDALSVAVAALRSTVCREVIADDYRAVLKVRAERHRDLARTRNQVACRLHAVLCDLVPGGHQKEISAAQAARILAQASPSAFAADRARVRRTIGIIGTHSHAVYRALCRHAEARSAAAGLHLQSPKAVPPTCTAIARFEAHRSLRSW